jgi:hypothetical protein
MISAEDTAAKNARTLLRLRLKVEKARRGLQVEERSETHLQWKEKSGSLFEEMRVVLGCTEYSEGGHGFAGMVYVLRDIGFAECATIAGW